MSVIGREGSHCATTIDGRTWDGKGAASDPLDPSPVVTGGQKPRSRRPKLSFRSATMPGGRRSPRRSAVERRVGDRAGIPLSVSRPRSDSGGGVADHLIKKVSVWVQRSSVVVRRVLRASRSCW